MSGLTPHGERIAEEQRTVINHALWNIFVMHAGANESERDSFLFHFPQCGEFSFRGDLGHGGKVYYNGGRVWTACYPEDLTDERQAAMNAINSRILLLRCPECKQYYMHKMDCSKRG